MEDVFSECSVRSPSAERYCKPRHHKWLLRLSLQDAEQLMPSLGRSCGKCKNCMWGRWRMTHNIGREPEPFGWLNETDFWYAVHIQESCSLRHRWITSREEDTWEQQSDFTLNGAHLLPAFQQELMQNWVSGGELLMYSLTNSWSHCLLQEAVQSH